MQFADDEGLLEFEVDEDIIKGSIQPIFYPYQAYFVLCFTFFKILEYFNNLMFLARKGCPHEVKYVEVYKIQSLVELCLKVCAKLRKSLNDQQEFFDYKPLQEQCIEL